MEGSVIIDFGTGWACSNEAVITLNREIVNIGGSRFSKSTQIIRALPYLNVYGTMEKEMEADVVFKEDSTDEKKGFRVKITGLTDQMVIMQTIGSIENYKLITKKIKGDYNHGK